MNSTSKTESTSTASGDAAQDAVQQSMDRRW
jgi:hypothetical protein